MYRIFHLIPVMTTYNFLIVYTSLVRDRRPNHVCMCLVFFFSLSLLTRTKLPRPVLSSFSQCPFPAAAAVVLAPSKHTSRGIPILRGDSCGGCVVLIYKLLVLLHPDSCSDYPLHPPTPSHHQVPPYSLSWSHTRAAGREGTWHWVLGCGTLYSSVWWWSCVVKF